MGPVMLEEAELTGETEAPPFMGTPEEFAAMLRAIDERGGDGDARAAAQVLEGQRSWDIYDAAIRWMMANEAVLHSTNVGDRVQAGKFALEVVERQFRADLGPWFRFKEVQS